MTAEDELVRFREEWKAEVQQRKLLLESGPSSALDVYRIAVQHEQAGNLDEALKLYRQAFRKESNLDRLYHRQELLASLCSPQDNPPSSDLTFDALTLTDVLMPAKIVSSAVLENSSTFAPEDETQPVYLNVLPDELLIHTLRMLGPTSIERFAAVSRKARAITLDSAIWRHLVKATYKPPQVSSVEDLIPVLRNFQGDFRKLYVEHPRVRMDGVYIAVCHYVRPGLSENSWVNISHLITYHRFLRFFPNGQVLSLLANEETPPGQIIPLLKPTLRMKGLLIGTWHLSGTTVHLTNLLDKLPGHSNEVRECRYAFGMSLTLRSRPVLGKWNKLEIASYESVNLETGDSTPIALKHDRPFWFSKVRSYGVA